MRTITIAEIRAVTGAEIIQGEPSARVKRVTTDTRVLAGGELFVALRGSRFDGHDFAGQAVDRGACGLLVSREVSVPSGVAVLKVADTLTALQALALDNRRRCGLPVIAVTGSTGKTTTKDLLTAVLAARFRVLATRENLNNEIGLPLTLLDVDPVHEVAVVELGMRAPGEIDLLARICEPTGGVITNIGETHLELLGSVANIARAKGELLDHIPPSGFAVLHAESPGMDEQARRCRGRVVRFGESESADFRLLDYRALPDGSVFRVRSAGGDEEYHLPLFGRHTALNALAAIAVGLELGLAVSEIRAGLEQARASSLRQAIVKAGGLTIINDTYNASPASVKAALEVLAEIAAGRPTVAILGGMLELGPRSPEAHREVGMACAHAGVGQLVTMGELAAGIAEGAREAGLPASRIWACHTLEETVGAARRLAGEDVVILVKGSRAFQMERIVKGLTEAATPAAGGTGRDGS
ncbi:MAG: UDP-N-acetylmuramoyl-tripeptide--D-alanyl-D-alanine ligase [Bacillota bacterium]